MMNYKLPSYIIDTGIDQLEIDYSWDDSDVEGCLDYHYAEIISEQVHNVSWRGKITLITGIYEWVLGRFRTLCRDPVYFKMAEAAYCGCINIYYLIPHEQLDSLKINRYDYLGPVDGALWCAGRSSLLPGFYIAENSAAFDDDYDEDYDYYTLHKWQGDLEFLVALVLHILPQDKTSIFKVWLDGVIARLLQFHTLLEDDTEDSMFSNLFGQKNDKERLGDYVARDILNLAFDYDPQHIIQHCDRYLKSVNYKENAFLLSPEEMSKKIKVPYRLLE